MRRLSLAALYLVTGCISPNYGLLLAEHANDDASTIPESPVVVSGSCAPVVGTSSPVLAGIGSVVTSKSTIVGTSSPSSPVRAGVLFTVPF